jgi:hypothetical protein
MPIDRDGNATVRLEKLPKWQQKSLAQLPNLTTADSVPNPQKLTEKMAILQNC